MKLWPFSRWFSPVHADEPAPRLEQKVSGAGYVVSAFHAGQPVWTDRRYDRLADEAYVRNAIGYRCIKLIATAAASAPWLLSKGKTEVDEHPLLDLLNRPGPMKGGTALFEAFYSYLLMAGNSYLEAVALNGRAPRELWTLRPDRMRVIAGNYGLPKGFEYEANGMKKTWDIDPASGAGPILHVKEFHPINDWYGLSRVEPAAFGIDRHNAASAHNKALLDNGARPSGAMIFKPVNVNGQMQSAPDDVIAAAEKRLKGQHSGTRNAGRPLVLGGDIDWLEMGISPKDMDFAEGKDDAARDVCVSFGVPHVLIVKGSATYNNVREAKMELWEDTILPLVSRVCTDIDAWLCPQFGDRLKLSIDHDAISALEPRREAKRKSTAALFKDKIITRDEARSALQYEPLPEMPRFDIDTGLLSAVSNAVKDNSLPIETLWRLARAYGLADANSTDEQMLASVTRALDQASEREEEQARAAMPEPNADDDDDRRTLQ